MFATAAAVLNVGPLSVDVVVVAIGSSKLHLSVICSSCPLEHLHFGAGLFVRSSFKEVNSVSELNATGLNSQRFVGFNITACQCGVIHESFVPLGPGSIRPEVERILLVRLTIIITS
jgi:hypothetical protein